VRPGTRFLLIVIGVFFAYFVIGTLAKYAITGSLGFLNKDFWSEVGDSLSTGVLFLVTFGKSQSGGGSGGGIKSDDDM
jgi:hypothetical protein